MRMLHDRVQGFSGAFQTKLVSSAVKPGYASYPQRQVKDQNTSKEVHDFAELGQISFRTIRFHEHLVIGDSWGSTVGGRTDGWTSWCLNLWRLYPDWLVFRGRENVRRVIKGIIEISRNPPSPMDWGPKRAVSKFFET